MSQIKTITCAGLDVHKESLQLHLAGRNCQLPNTPAGLKKLLLLLSRASSPERPLHLIAEASGGYEQPVADCLHQHAILVSIVNPRQVRQFAHAMGRRTKTDPIDAEMLARFGQCRCPLPTPAPSEQERQLRELCRYRQQLLASLAAHKQQLEHITFKVLGAQGKSLVRRMAEDLKKVNALLAELVASSSALQAKVERLCQCKGVAFLTAVQLLAECPELGTLAHGQAAALAGLVPHARSSGKWVGKSCIGGGRAALRKALYMAALCASRFHPSLSVFFKRLRSAGKPPKLALTALMRKLICLLNLALKNPNFPLAS